MVGIGPFVPHHDTPFANEPGGTAEKTILMVALTRILLPNALIPSTTALGTIDPSGREKGILSGANVVMPNPFADRREIKVPFVRQQNLHGNGGGRKSCRTEKADRRNRLRYRRLTRRCQKINKAKNKCASPHLVRHIFRMLILRRDSHGNDRSVLSSTRASTLVPSSRYSVDKTVALL